MKKCPYCAEDIHDAAVVCKHCGRDLAGGASQVQIVQPKKKTSPAAWGCLVVIVLFVLFAIIGQCSRPTTPAQTPRAATAAAPESSALVSRRNPTAAQLAGFVVKVGEERCPTARRTFLQGVDEKQEAWNVECSTGKSYAVMLENSGTVRVLGCDVLRAVSKVQCWKTFDAQR